MRYEIRILGHLSPQWRDWFGDLTIVNTEQGEAILTGWLPDNAALYGILNQIQAFNLTLIAVNPLPEPAGNSTADSSSDE